MDKVLKQTKRPPKGIRKFSFYVHCQFQVKPSRCCLGFYNPLPLGGSFYLIKNFFRNSSIDKKIISTRAAVFFPFIPPRSHKKSVRGRERQHKKMFYWRGCTQCEHNKLRLRRAENSLKFNEQWTNFAGTAEVRKNAKRVIAIWWCTGIAFSHTKVAALRRFSYLFASLDYGVWKHHQWSSIRKTLFADSFRCGTRRRIKRNQSHDRRIFVNSQMRILFSYLLLFHMIDRPNDGNLWEKGPGAPPALDNGAKFHNFNLFLCNHFSILLFAFSKDSTYELSLYSHAALRVFRKNFSILSGWEE